MRVKWYKPTTLHIFLLSSLSVLCRTLDNSLFYFIFEKAFFLQTCLFEKVEKSLLCFKLSLYLQFEQCIYIMISFIMYICLCVSSKGRIYKELWELRWSRHLFHLGNTGHNFREAECELDIEEGNVLLMERKAFSKEGDDMSIGCGWENSPWISGFQFWCGLFFELNADSVILIWIPFKLDSETRFGCLQVVYLELLSRSINEEVRQWREKSTNTGFHWWVSYLCGLPQGPVSLWEPLVNHVGHIIPLEREGKLGHLSLKSHSALVENWGVR